MYLTCLSFPRFLSSVLCFQHRDPVVHSLGEFLAKYLMFFGVTVNATVLLHFSFQLWPIHRTTIDFHVLTL